MSVSQATSYSFVRPPDGSWGTMMQNGSWSGMVGVLTRREADIGLGPFAMSASRAKVINYLRPILVDYIKILGGRGRPEVDPWGFLLPLAPLVWVVLFLVLIGVTLFMSLPPCVSLANTTNTGILDNLFLLYETLLQQSAREDSGRWSWQRLTIGPWLLMVLVLSRSYSGNLMSQLAVRHIPQPYQSLRDVLDDPRASMIWETNTAYVQYINSVQMGMFHEVAEAGKNGRILYKKGFEFPEVVDDTVREGDTVLMVEDLTAKVLLAHLFTMTGQCSFYVSRDSYLPYIFSMIIQKNDRLTPYINNRIRAVTEAGLYERWVADSIPNSTSCFNAPTTITITSALSLSNLRGLFVMVAGGYLCAVVTLCLEVGKNLSRKAG